MRFCATGLIFCSCALLCAGELQDRLNQQWQGKVVLIKMESRSHCNGNTTDNQLTRDRLNSSGDILFPAGELARVRKVDLKRSRLDLLLDVEIPVLASYEDGPFVLYDERPCSMEIMIDVPRAMVKDRDEAALHEQIERVLMPFPHADAAQQSEFWNQRERAPYPADYEQTLAQHAIWKAEQTNRAVQDHMDQSVEEALLAVQRVQTDTDFALGFVTGIREITGQSRGDCDDLLQDTFFSSRSAPPDRMSKAWKEGFEEGQKLAFHLVAAHALRECFVPVPRP